MNIITVIPQKIAPREICGVTHHGKAFPLTEAQAVKPLQLGLVRLPKAKAVRPAKTLKTAPKDQVAPVGEATAEPPAVEIDSQDGDVGPDAVSEAAEETNPDA